MAGDDLEVQEQDQDQDQEETQAAGSKKSMLIVIILVVSLITALSLVYFVLYPKYQEMTGGADSTLVEEEPEKKEIVVGKLFKIEGLTVNPKNSMGRRFVVLDIVLEYQNEEDELKLNEFRPLIFDALLKYFRSKTVEHYSAQDAMEIMRVEIIVLVNEILPEEIITNLYFTRYMLE